MVKLKIELLPQYAARIDFEDSQEFTFQFSQCQGEAENLVAMICAHAGIPLYDPAVFESPPSFKLLLDPCFVVLDLECIQDGDTLILRQTGQAELQPSNNFGSSDDVLMEI